MAELHDALKYLAPLDWNEVPQDNLEQFLRDGFTAGELICNSVPQLPNGTPFDSSKPHHRQPNQAKSHKDIHTSDARSQPPHADHESLQKNWGKPYKFSAKDNPLGVQIYKMAGHDRHGAWFARRSVHEGIGFARFKSALMREFPTSMSVSGGPGAGAIRGLTADRRLEQFEVKDVGTLGVYHLSAQFPGPVTPRDFTVMVATGDDALSEKSAAQLENGKKHVPRHFMNVSRPISHPEAPQQAGLVRGHYESVEMIREVPLSTAKSKSTPNLLSTSNGLQTAPRDRGQTVSNTDLSSHGDDHSLGEPQDDPELNPVEWIMITRSDPGGGIPRFLVDRGTPDAMLGDLVKFFNWACTLDDAAGPNGDLENRALKQPETDGNAASLPNRNLENPTASHPPSQHSTAESAPRTGDGAQQQGGIMSTLTKAIEAGLDSYAPAMLRTPEPAPTADSSDEDSSSDSSSANSFMSAEEMRRFSSVDPAVPAADSTDTLSVASGDVSESLKDKKNLNHHDKEIAKLVQKREKLDQRLAKRRHEEQARLRQVREKEEGEASKTKEKMEKELSKTEEKHRKEVEKLEAKKAKEERKAEERRRKKDETYRMSLVARERDEFRSQVDLLRREGDLLREQVRDLQAQTTVLADRLGKVGGEGGLKGVQDEMGRKRTGSMKSVGS